MSGSTKDNIQDAATGKEQEKITPPDFTQLKKQPLFHDIIQSIGLSLGEIGASGDHLDLGLLRWQFSPEARLKLTGKTLITPPIETLAASSKLKRQLWQLLQEHSV
ncbi:hypothetical protein [Thalassomonas viridans]|uniref:hypothetical protein n=1 Tax=Thalassomonas viridans TaxID=137584 RepID=UPI002361F2E7|nr:hypothetical protein [Thalassomonas viridans]